MMDFKCKEEMCGVIQDRILQKKHYAGVQPVLVDRNACKNEWIVNYTR